MNEFEEINYCSNTIIDNESNQLIYQDLWKKKIMNQKEKGYRLVYIQNIMEVMLMINSTKDSYILLDILSNRLKNSYEVLIDYKEISKYYNISNSRGRKFITKMKSLDLLRGDRGKYIANPYLVIPYGMSDKEVTINQIKWSNNGE